MENNDLIFRHFINKEILVNLVDNASKRMEELSREYFDLINQYKQERDQAINNCNVISDSINSEYKKIKDPVFEKQMKLLKTSTYSIDDFFDVETSYAQYISDIQCILQSKVPPWLSSLCFTFNHKWRQVVYEEIIKNYIKISLYIDNELERAKEICKQSISNKELEFRKKILLEYNNLTNEIKTEIYN